MEAVGPKSAGPKSAGPKSAGPESAGPESADTKSAGTEKWRAIARAQAGLITRAQLRESRVSSHAVAHRVRAERWQLLSPSVVATVTGELTSHQRLWLGVLHGGPTSLIAGVHAAVLGGLQRWDREIVTVFVPYRARTPRPL